MNKDINEIDYNECKEHTLGKLLAQISAFDQKAGILISVLGIVFALSFTLIDVINNKDIEVRTILYAFFMLFLASLMFSLSTSILVIYPRKRKNKAAEKSFTYYMDLINISDAEFNKRCESKNGFLIEQINENARICRVKHLFVKLSIFGLIFVALFFVVSASLIIWL
ncbi:MAG: DUF5706 domain-containing protein [Erysipelotrichales bacterium]|nr:DUF5706 domain-containing protein [Erysipelotrichales bacterium]